MKLVAFMPTPRGMTGGPRRLLTLALTARNSDIDVVIASDEGSTLLERAMAVGLATAPVRVVGVLGQRGGALLKGGVFFRVRVAIDLIRNNLLIARLIRQHKADAIWIRGSKGFAFAGLGAFISGRPVIWDVDGEPRTKGGIGLLLYAASRMSRAVVVQYSDAMKKVFGERARRVLKKKTVSLVPGINLEALNDHRCKKGSISIDRKVFRVIQVGSVCDNKNQSFTLEAFSRMRDCGGIELWLVGGALDVQRQRELEERVGEERFGGNVVFLGWRDDIHVLMAEADLLVMPSKDEGVPNTVQEAMAIGLPVIVSDAGGMPEIVSHGKTGWVLPLDDPESWARQIDVCRRDPAMCRSVGEAAAVYAAEHFGTENWGREYAAVIKSVVRDRKGR